MGYLKSLLDYRDLLETRLPQLQWREEGEGAQDMVISHSALGIFVGKVLGALQDNIHEKSRTYKSHTLKVCAGAGDG